MSNHVGKIINNRVQDVAFCHDNRDTAGQAKNQGAHDDAATSIKESAAETIDIQTGNQANTDTHGDKHAAHFCHAPSPGDGACDDEDEHADSKDP